MFMVEFPFSVNVGPDKTSETCDELNKEMETVPESARLKLSFVDEIVKFSLSKPLLGICLGMQILSTTGSEFEKINGLNLIQGNVIKFKNDENPLSTNVGWMKISPKINHEIFKNVNFDVEFYFDHSYYFKPSLGENILSVSKINSNFCSSVINKNIFGFQFHIEKSHKNGLKILENFCNL